MKQLKIEHLIIVILSVWLIVSHYNNKNGRYVPIHRDNGLDAVIDTQTGIYYDYDFTVDLVNKKIIKTNKKSLKTKANLP